MRVLITGSRNWPAPEAIWQTLDIIASECADKVLRIMHGGCPEGADLAAHVWASNHSMILPDRVYVVEEICRAPWAVMDKRAGFWRNRFMVDNNRVDRCIAFISPCVKPDCTEPRPHDSHGTAHCADYAAKQHIPTWRYYA